MADTPILKRLWPKPEKQLTLAEALEAAGDASHAQDLKRTAASLEAARDLLEAPILAVFGQLNSGKSSLVSSFLSPESQARLPRGSSAAQGTHRFVYWVPQAWLDDPARWQALEKLLAAAHGTGLEHLAKDPEEAAAQYAAGRDNLQRLRLPLVAGDEALNKLGAALLDCPDVQTRDESPAETQAESKAQQASSEQDPGQFKTNPRLDFLVQAAQLCSAFLVVWRRDALRDRLLEELLTSLRARLPHAPLHLAINFVRPSAQEPLATLQEPDLTRLCQRFQIPPEARYLALDAFIEARGKIPGWRELTPTVTLPDPDEAEDHPVPRFYRAAHLAKDSATLEDFQPEKTPKSDLLLELPKQLDLAELQKRHLSDQEKTLKRLQSEAQVATLQWAREQNKILTAAHQGLLHLCTDQLTDAQGKPLQVPSPAFAAALSEAMSKQAPIGLRQLLLVAKPFERATSKVRDTIRSVKRAIDAQQKPAEVLQKAASERLKVGGLKLVDAEDLSRAMQAQRWCPAEIPLEELEEAWNAILQCLQEHPVEAVDKVALEKIAANLWQDLPLKSKFGIGARAALGSLGSIAAAGGLLFAVVDGGAMAFGAVGIANALNGALATAIATAGTLSVSMAFSKGLLDTNTIPWLGRLFAIACDHFGLPRRLPEQEAPSVSFRLSDTQKETRALPDDPLPQQKETLTLAASHWAEEKRTS